MAHQESVRSISAFVDAVNEGNQAAALARLTPDVTIIEDLPPYCWHGPNAGAEWMLAMARNAELAGMTGISMEIGSPTRVEVEGRHGYAVVPGTLKLSGKGPPLRAEGSLIFSLRNVDGDWLISSFAWGGMPPHP